MGAKLMEKLEKVKKGLKCCMANTPDDPFQKCEECPYNEISIAVEDCRAVLSRESLEVITEVTGK